MELVLVIARISVSVVTLFFIVHLLVAKKGEVQDLLRKLSRPILLVRLRRVLQAADSYAAGYVGRVGARGFVWRVLFLYYLAVPTLAVLYQPTNPTDPTNQSPLVGYSWLLAIILHLWILSNVAADLLSVWISRRELRNVCANATMSGWGYARAASLVLGTAVACLLFVVFSATVCYSLQTEAPYIFKFDVLTRPYSIVHGGQHVFTTTRVVFWIAASTYIPSLVLAVSLVFAALVHPVLKAFSLVSKKLAENLVTGEITTTNLITAVATIASILLTLLALAAQVLTGSASG